ncbi:MAG TPA: hypothetical protein VD931_02515 [Baekduia sp.]|nr:hypothetical protein [Baekduia sp.]
METSDRRERAQAELKELEDDPPKKLEDWPSGDAKYETFGGKEGDHSYEEGPERKLGPSGVEHHDDGSVTIEGEPVDDPSQFKGERVEGATQTLDQDRFNR